MNRDMTVPCEEGVLNIRVGAIIMKNNKILMVGNKVRPEYLYSVGGRIKFGETSEEAIVREVFEETGINVKNIRYAGSQCWPFPDQFMLAFRAEYESGEIKVQPEEISEAKWFKKDQLPSIPPAGSVAHNLITGVFD